MTAVKLTSMRVISLSCTVAGPAAKGVDCAAHAVHDSILREAQQSVAEAALGESPTHQAMHLK
jgi:ABC-type iron transport system FetAB permease component